MDWSRTQSALVEDFCLGRKDHLREVSCEARSAASGRSAGPHL